MPKIILFDIIFSNKAYVWSKIIRYCFVLNKRFPSFSFSSNFTKKRISIKAFSIKSYRIVTKCFIRINPIGYWFLIKIHKALNWELPNTWKIQQCVCAKRISITSSIINSIGTQKSYSSFIINKILISQNTIKTFSSNTSKWFKLCWN